MPQPTPPVRPEPEQARGSWLAMLLAAAVGLVIFTGLVFLTGGFLALVLVIGGGVFALAALHYVVWGWWLSDSLYREEERAEAERQEEAEWKRRGS